MRFAKASRAEQPHISSDGCNAQHTAGRSGFPKSLQRLSGVNCTQRTPVGFPLGMPGMGEEIDGAIQQAPQPTLHSIVRLLVYKNKVTKVYRFSACFLLYHGNQLEVV
jgi:hypothetical protein